MNAALSLDPMIDPIGAFGAYLREERMRSGRTVHVYCGHVRGFFSFLRDRYGCDDPDVAATDQEDIRSFLRCAGKGNTQAPSPSAFNNRLAALRSFYDYAEERGLVRSNPARGVRRIKAKKRKSRMPLSFEEMIRLVDAAKATPRAELRSRNAAIILVLLHNSFRVSELVSLNVDQVDVQGHVFSNVQTKGDQRLSLRFNDLVGAALEAYLADRPQLGPIPNEPGLWLSIAGSRLSVRAVQDVVERSGRRAGITRKIMPHLLRHTSGTALASVGADIYTIKAQLGHADISTTERYVHAGANGQEAAVRAMEHHWREVESRLRSGVDTPNRQEEER